jgi:hypothetical protein
MGLDAALAIPLSKIPGCEISRACKKREKRQFRGEKAPFGAKKGQNQGFAVTNSLTGRKFKLLIPCKLRGIKWSKKDFHR